MRKKIYNHQVTKKYQKIKTHKNTLKLILQNFKIKKNTKIKSLNSIINIKNPMFKRTFVKMIQVTRRINVVIQVDSKISQIPHYRMETII